MKNIITFIVIITFLWSNIVWAGGMDTLAPKSNLPVLYLPVQVDILTREVLRALDKEGVKDNRTLYLKRQRIEEEIGKVMKGSGDKIRFLVFPDLDRANERAYYIFNMDEDYYIRITTTRDVKDRFQDILNNMDEPRSGGIKEIDKDGYYYEVFEITPRIKPFILECLEKIYPIVKPPEVKAEKEKPPMDKKRFLQEPNNVCNPDIWERYKFGYGRFIGDSFKALREIKEPVKVSIVVPMYKEEVRLRPKSPDNTYGEDAFRRKVLQLEACRLINPLFEWELIFVDNGTSEGASGKLVERLWEEVQIECKEYGIKLAPQQVKVLYITPEEAKQMGSIKGGAVYKGVQYVLNESNPDVIFYTDTDISVDLRQIGLLLEPIVNREYDVAIGSRWLKESLRDKKTIIDTLASRLYNFIVRLLLPLGNIKDTQCGFKAFRRELLEKVIPYTSDYGFSFDTELLTLSKTIGSRVEEVPIAWFGSSVETKVDLLRDAFRMISGLWRQRQFFYRTGIKVKLEPEDINLRSFIKYLCHKETAINLPVEERLDLLSKSLSILLKRDDAEEIAEGLRVSLIAEKEELLPEARMMIESYLAIFHIKDPMTIAVCIALWKGQEDFRDEPDGSGWLNAKVNQFFRGLLSVNPNVNGYMVFVNDGDDSKDEKKTSDVIRELLKGKKYSDVKDKIYVLDLPKEDKQKMGSIKHGALACGMRFSAGIGVDLIMYTDSDLSSHLGLSGLLIDSIINAGNDVAFGSIGEKGAVVPYRAFWRNLGTIVYNWWVRLLLSPIRDIKDTQRSLKMFRREVLEKILPVEIEAIDENGNLKINFNKNFMYDFTGDTEWLGRAKILRLKLDEVPIVWIDSPETSTVDFWKQVIPMFISAWHQRKTQRIFKPKTTPKNLHRGRVDELKETHPALENAANTGRMFAVKVSQLHGLPVKQLDELTGIFVENLFNLKDKGYTRKRIYERLKDPSFRKNLLKGFALIREAMEEEGPGIEQDKIRLCIVIEDNNLPTIVFKDIYNNLISHSGHGKKTGSSYTSIYTGYKGIKFAVKKGKGDCLKKIIRHEIRDIRRERHIDLEEEVKDGVIAKKEADDINNFYNEVICEVLLDKIRGSIKDPYDTKWERLRELSKGMLDLNVESGVEVLNKWGGEVLRGWFSRGLFKGTMGFDGEIGKKFIFIMLVSRFGGPLIYNGYPEQFIYEVCHIDYDATRYGEIYGVRKGSLIPGDHIKMTAKKILDRDEEARFSLRGTLAGDYNKEDGFLRLDTPIDKGKFIGNLCKDNPENQSKDFNALLREQILDTLKFLIKYVRLNPNKELVLINQVKEIFEQWKGAKLPERISIKKFIKWCESERKGLVTTVDKGVELSGFEVMEKVRVDLPLGIHAHVAGQIVKAVSNLSAEVSIMYKERIASTKSIIEILLLGIGPNEEITLAGNGIDAKKAIEAIKGILVNAYKKELEDRILPLYPEQILWVRMHARRVARLAEIIAKRSGLNDDLIRLLYIAALSHDLGKGSSQKMIDEVNKPTEVRPDIIEVHPEESLEILERNGIEINDTVKSVILYHHTPHLIKDSNIRTIAEIIYLADEIDASQDTDRPYKNDFTNLDISEKQLGEGYKKGIISDNTFNITCQLLKEKGLFMDIIYEARGGARIEILENSNSLLWKILNSGTVEECLKARGIIAGRLKPLEGVDNRVYEILAKEVKGRPSKNISILVHGFYLWDNTCKDVDIIVIVPGSDIYFEHEFYYNNRLIKCTYIGDNYLIKNNLMKQISLLTLVTGAFLKGGFKDVGISDADLLKFVDSLLKDVVDLKTFYLGWPDEYRDLTNINIAWRRCLESLLYLYLFTNLHIDMRGDLNKIIDKYFNDTLPNFLNKIFIGESDKWNDRKAIWDFADELQGFLIRCRDKISISTLKAPTTEALMHRFNCNFGYIEGMIRDSEEKEFPKELIDELRRRGPPFEGLVDALEKKKLRLFVVTSPLFGIPRYEGAVFARDTIPAYSIPDKQGNLCVHITSELYGSLLKDYRLFGFILDHEFYEKGSIPHKAHRQVWKDRGWLEFFVDKKTGINNFIKLYIDRLAKEGDIEGLDRFEPSRDRNRRLVYRYVKKKKQELLERGKVFLTIKDPDERTQALNDMWRLNKASNENGINLQVQSDGFENEEIYAYISNPEYVKGKDCMLFFDNLDSNQEVVKLLFTVGLLEDCGARSITCKLPNETPDWLKKVLEQFRNPIKKGISKKDIEHILFMPNTEKFKPVDMPGAMDITIDEEGNIILPEDLKSGDNCLLVYSTDAVNGLLRLFEVLSILEEKGISIELFIPHFSYMRQHKSYRMKKHGRFAVSNNSAMAILKAICRFSRRIYTANIHFSKEPGPMDAKSEFPDLADVIEIYNLNLFPVLAEYFKDKGKMDNPIIVSADKGGDIYCRDTAKKTGIEYGGHMDKERDPSKPVHLQVMMIMPDIDVKDRDVIVLDDIISSGTTIINAALLLKSRGAKRVFVGCVYGEFTYGIGIFNNRRMRYKQMEQLKKLGQLSDEQIGYLGRCKLIDGIVSTDIMPNRTSAIFIKDLLKNVINTRNKDMHRGNVDELKDTHPALEKAANSGRMFALYIERARDIKRFFYLDNEDMVNIFLGFLQNLDNPIETRNKMLQRLSDPVFRGNLITGFQMMYDSIKDQPLPKDKPIRLCIVIEDEGLPTIVFKDPFNNFISHSGSGVKTNIPYISIYAGYNSIKVAIARKMEEGFRKLVGHELKDIIRGYHVDDYPAIVDEFYNKVLISAKPLVEISSEAFLYDHMTSFFRNMPHYKWLREVVLPRVSPDKEKYIKIAVLGCSTGQEPISIAIWLLENGYKNFEIVSIDRNPQVLGKFEDGIYTQKEMNRFIIYGNEVFDCSGEDMQAMINKYFQYSSEDLTYTLREELRDRLRNKVLSDITTPGNIQKAVGKADILFYSNIAYRYEEPVHEIVAEGISRVSDWVFVSTKKYDAIKRLTERYGLPIRREWFYSLFWKVFKGLSQEWQESIKDPFDEFTEHSIDILFDRLKDYTEEEIRYGIDIFNIIFRNDKKALRGKFQHEVADMIEKAINYIARAKEDLVKRYGPGLLSGIKDIRIVEKDEPASRDSIARIGIERTRHRLLVEERLLYEAVHEILGLIIPDKPELAEVVAISYRVRWFSELSQEEQEVLIGFGYTPRVELKGIDLDEIRKTENILQEILILFNELIWAKGGDIEGESIRVIKTFNNIRIEGRDIPRNVRRTIGFVARWLDIIQGRSELLPSDLSKKYYVLVDKERFKEYKDTIDEVSKKWNVDFVTEIPKGVSEKEIIALVDPEDSDKWDGIEFRYYLPIPYMFLSFNLAAELATTETELKGTNAFRFVKGFYENFLGTPLEDDEVLMWFSRPWMLEDKLLKLKEELDMVRFAIKELEDSA